MRTTTSCPRFVLVLLLVAFSLAAATPAVSEPAPPHYKMFLPITGYPGSNLLQINNRGTAVGFGYLSFDAPQPSDLVLSFARGQLISLHPLSGAHAYGLGINDLDDVVGTAEKDDFVVPFLRKSTGTMALLQTLGGRYNSALAINASRQIVGLSSQESGLFHAVLWTPDGRVRDLTPLSSDYSAAYSINKLGYIVGGTASSDDETQNAFMYVNSVFTLLFGPRPYSTAFDINSAGTIVGASFEGFRTNSVATKWEGTVPSELPNFDPPRETGASGINDRGDIVGYARNGDPQTSAVLWQDGQIYDLNDLTTNLGEYKIIAAYDINIHGEIVATCAHRGQADFFGCRLKRVD